GEGLAYDRLHGRRPHSLALLSVEAFLDFVVVEGFVPVGFGEVLYGPVSLFRNAFRRDGFDLRLRLFLRGVAVFELQLRGRLFFLLNSESLAITSLKPSSLPSSLSSTRVGRAIKAARRKSSHFPPMLWAIS